MSSVVMVVWVACVDPTSQRAALAQKYALEISAVEVQGPKRWGKAPLAFRVLRGLGAVAMAYNRIPIGKTSKRLGSGPVWKRVHEEMQKGVSAGRYLYQTTLLSLHNLNDGDMDLPIRIAMYDLHYC